MERNPIVTDEQVKTAVAALAEIAQGGSGTAAVAPECRVNAAATLLSHAWVYGSQVGPDPAPEGA